MWPAIRPRLSFPASAGTWRDRGGIKRSGAKTKRQAASKPICFVISNPDKSPFARLIGSTLSNRCGGGIETFLSGTRSIASRARAVYIRPAPGYPWRLIFLDGPALPTTQCQLRASRWHPCAQLLRQLFPVAVVRTSRGEPGSVRGSRVSSPIETLARS